MRRFFLFATGAGFFFLLEDVFFEPPNSAAWPFFFEPNPMGKADDFFLRASAASRSALASASAFAAFSPVGSAQSVFDDIWTSHRMRAARASLNASPASDSSSRSRRLRGVLAPQLGPGLLRRGDGVQRRLVVLLAPDESDGPAGDGGAEL